MQCLRSLVRHRPINVECWKIVPFGRLETFLFVAKNNMIIILSSIILDKLRTADVLIAIVSVSLCTSGRRIFNYSTVILASSQTMIVIMICIEKKTIKSHQGELRLTEIPPLTLEFRKDLTIIGFP